jgi:hypothetical protein
LLLNLLALLRATLSPSLLCLSVGVLWHSFNLLYVSNNPRRRFHLPHLCLLLGIDVDVCLQWSSLVDVLVVQAICRMCLSFLRHRFLMMWRYNYASKKFFGYLYC